MRIAYIIDDDISTNSGVIEKIKAKLNIWKANDHQVLLISLRSKTMISIIDDSIIISERKDLNIIRKFIYQSKNINKLDIELKKFKPDLIYTRYIKYYFQMANILKQNAPYIVEINSNDVQEYKHRGYITYIFNILTRQVLLKNATAFISVSNELIANSSFSKFNKKFNVIANGYKFNINNHLNSNKTNIINLIFIGTPGQSWHGFDKVIQLAKNNKDFIFHIVGPQKNEFEKKMNIPSNVIIYGYCTKKEIENIISQCDVGISTLALHRKGMNEASPLKSRQYLSYGLPIIIGYEDTDLNVEKKYILNIGNEENNILNNLDNIRSFCKKSKCIDKEEIIKDSIKYLSLEKKEKKRILFFKSILK